MAVYYDSIHKTWYVKFKYKDWQGKTHNTTRRGFGRKKDAIAYEHDYKLRAQQNPSLTINALVKEYLADYKLNRKESSYRNVKRIINNHVLPDFDNYTVNSITPYHIKQWQNSLAEKDYSLSSIKTFNNVFNTLLNYAVKYHGLPSNPFNVTGTTGRMQTSLDFWELDEFQKFISAVEDPVYKVIFNILFYSGLRVGELMALEVEDFDFDRNTISISKQYNDDYNSVTIPKTASSVRTVTLPPSIMAMVKDLFDSYYEIPRPRPFSYVSRKGIRFVMDRAAEKAGVHKIKIHDLRHSHASMLIRQGINVAAIAQRLGHSSATTTLNIYSHVYQNDDKHIANILEGIK